MLQFFLKFLKQEVQEVQCSKQDEPKEAHTKGTLTKMAKVKDKERILRAAREK